MSATNMNLRDYQEAAVTSAIDFLKRGVNPLVIAPTGAGKTVIASEIMKRWMSANPGKKVVFVAHRKELLSQAKATMERFGILDNAYVASVFTTDFSDIPDADKTSALVVFDEAHHAVATSWTGFCKLFTGPKVAVTATPDRMDRQKLEDVGFSLAYDIAIRTLIEAGHLVRPMAQKMPVELSMIRMRGYDEAMEAVAVSVIDEFRRWDRKRAIVFLPDVELSERFAELLRKHGMTAADVDAKMHPYNRQRIVDMYKGGEVQFLCNVNLFTEGFDAPETDCIVLLRPTQSRALWCQMIGRGLRTAPDKTDCLILDPMWISGDHTFQPADAFTTNPFAKMRQVEGSHDILGAAEMADRDAEQNILARIAAEEKRASAKEARDKGCIDLSVACSCFGFILPPVDSQTPATASQKAELERFKVYAGGEVTTEQASWMLSRLYFRQRCGLATPKQVRKLVQFGFKNAERMTFEQAGHSISNDWRMTSR